MCITGSFQGQVGLGVELSDLVKDIPVRGKGFGLDDL